MLSRYLATAALGIILLIPRPASAQTFESVGTRAQGMAGAFVAVADDATATWWNPAGLATGAYFSAVLEGGIDRQPSDVPPSGPAVRTRTSGFSVAFPALGLSYYRLRISEIAARSTTTAAAAPGRQEEGAAVVSVRAVGLSQFGVTTGQSVGDHLVVASTLKLLRGGVTTGRDDPRGAAALSDAADLDVSGETHGDIDLGAMAAFGKARLGVTLRHLTAPTFGSGDTRHDLKRQGRAGVSVSGHPRGLVTGVTVAFDADLTKTATAIGDVRRIAAGAELAALRGRVAVRGGLSRNTLGEARSTASVGGSLGLTARTFLDAALTSGSDESPRSWSVAGRLTF